MAKERSEKCCYESRFGGGWITAENYLAENMVARKARSKGQSLPQRFWEDAYWRKEMLAQIRHAASLLKEFSIEAILSALRHSDAKYIYSLGLRSTLVPLIRKSQALLDYQTGLPATQVEDINIRQKPLPPFGRQPSLLQRIRDLEDYGKEKT